LSGAGGAAKSKPTTPRKLYQELDAVDAHDIPRSLSSEPLPPISLTPDELNRRNEIIKRLDPKGFGLMNPSQFEGDDLYLLLAPVSGGKGTSPIACRAPMEIRQAIEYILMQRVTPFQSISEFMVSAAVLMLKTVADLERGTSQWRNSVRVINMGIVRARSARRLADSKAYFDETETLIKLHLNNGEREEALRVWSQIKDEIEAMEDSSWKEKGMRWLDEIDPLLDPPKRPVPTPNRKLGERRR
jgi:hypothetical protein